MNKILLNRSLFFLIIICLMTLISCNDLLEEKPKTVAGELFYSTPEEVETAINAAYLPFKGSVWAELIVRLDTHTDWGYGRGTRSILNNVQGFTSIDEMSSYWTNFYLIIRNANIVIQNTKVNEKISEADVEKFVAEARFLRALAYYHLVRNYGSVPLRTETNLKDRDLAKSSVTDIYAFILEDLEYAENYLPEIPSKSGKPGIYAAKTLLADVYLTLGEYAKARNKADEVIKSNKYALVQVTSEDDIRKNIFGPDLVTSTEEVFYIKYTRQVGFGNWILWVLNHETSGCFNYGGAYAHYGDNTNIFFTRWDDIDLRKRLWDNINFGLGTTTMVCGKYADTEAVDKSLGAGNDLPLLRYADALLIYAEASCLAGNGPTAEGMEILNQVHRRAYGLDPKTVSPVDFKQSDYNVQSFQDLVLQERAYEFIFEGKRWYDLKRTGKAAAIIGEAKKVTIPEKAYLWPIPSSELNYNQALNPETDQNPGY
ncbi:RagB/SusD family nutrient uptake outer membrane protein [Parabacteroides sp. Marseille-P3160]|uniref:RagB/SusD family nutrient uptake outer membrane protein n=1 Tax=Parabacteroides sp. Marseille-P3160 TaxID=1917887 RepID=UPI0009BC2806|nr:RagB/SusD family nutrient uptake outer membrane protein [Parabacteroides sp. Marseille-P3160]